MGQVTYTLNYADKLTFPSPSSVSSDSQEIIQLKQQVQSLVKFVQTLLSPDARTTFQQEQQHQSKQHQQGSQQNQDQDQDQDHHHYSTYQPLGFHFKLLQNVSIRPKLLSQNFYFHYIFMFQTVIMYHVLYLLHYMSNSLFG